MSAPCVLLVGTSHIVSLRNAQTLRQGRGEARFEFADVELFPRFDPLLSNVDGRLVVNPAIEPALAELAAARPPSLIAAALWGDQHFFLSTANLPRRLDFVLPEAPDLPFDDEAEIVPYDLIAAYIGHHFEFARQVAEALKRVSAAPLLLLPAPAPVRDFAAFARGSSSERLDRLVAEHGPAPPWLRYKFWRLALTIHAEIARAVAAELAPPPEGATDADGFRLPEHHHTDWLHANSAYGELVLRQLDARLAAL